MKKEIYIIVTLLLVAVISGIAYYSFSQKRADLKEAFELDKKESGTKVYYSDKLGVGFTYLPFNSDSKVKLEISESENEIKVMHQSLKVFAKDPNFSLQQAIEYEFLEGYDPKDCFVEINDSNGGRSSNYITASISYPHPDDPNTAWWSENNCPKPYGEANGLRYFLMDKNKAEKFLFLDLGQAATLRDGTIDSNNGWEKSIRILK